MEDFDLRFSETQRSAEFGPDMAELLGGMVATTATALWVLACLVAVAVAVWMFTDAKRRGKSGFAAAMIAFLSAFYGIPLTLIVLCTWILFRPEKSQRHVSGSENDLPEELPSGIVLAPSPSEFLEGLGEEVRSSPEDGTT